MATQTQETTKTKTWVNPRTNFGVSPTHYILEIELSGVNQENISITQEKNQVVIETVGQAGSWPIQEFFPGPFKKKVVLPEDSQADSVKATFLNGILTLSIQKAEDPKPKKITIEKGETS